jgi:hypothetical protein
MAVIADSQKRDRFIDRQGLYQGHLPTVRRIGSVWQANSRPQPRTPSTKAGRPGRQRPGRSVNDAGRSVSVWHGGAHRVPGLAETPARFQLLTSLLVHDLNETVQAGRLCRHWRDPHDDTIAVITGCQAVTVIADRERREKSKLEERRRGERLTARTPQTGRHPPIPRCLPSRARFMAVPCWPHCLWGSSEDWRWVAEEPGRRARSTSTTSTAATCWRRRSRSSGSAASTRISSEGYWGIRSSWPGKITSGSSSTLRLASKMIVNLEGSP